MATKEEILDYVDNTPENSNRNVLSGMLDSYGGGSSGEGPLLVNVVYEDPSTQTKGLLRGGDSGGQWLDKDSTTIFNALLSRGVIVHQYIPGDDEVSPGDSYFHVSSWYKVESEGLFGFVVDGVDYKGSGTDYPVHGGA